MGVIVPAFICSVAFGLALLVWFSGCEPLPKYAIYFWLVTLLSTFSLPANGEVAVAHYNRRNGLPASDYVQNPYSYVYGSIVERDLIRGDKGQYGTNIAFQPRYASEVFIERVLFCGDRADMFRNVQGPVVVTYRRLAHKMVRDVPCFELVTVERIESSQEQSSR